MNNAMKRTVYFVSESTGITAEALGHSLISQFDTVNFEQVYMPLINTIPRAVALTERMQEAANRDGARPICFATMMNTEIRNILKAGNCFYMELFDVFIDPLAAELGVPPSRRAGLSHAITQVSSYTKRIAAINFAMANDDGMHPENFPRADLILIGVKPFQVASLIAEIRPALTAKKTVVSFAASVKTSAIEEAAGVELEHPAVGALDGRGGRVAQIRQVGDQPEGVPLRGPRAEEGLPGG